MNPKKQVKVMIDAPSSHMMDEEQETRSGTKANLLLQNDISTQHLNNILNSTANNLFDINGSCSLLVD